MQEVLNNFQRDFLKTLGKTELSRYFLWSGGTALSFYYLKHRLSFDLDFFSQELLPDDYLLLQIKKIFSELKVKKFEEIKKLNRYEFFFNRDKEKLKVELVFYPFPYIKPPQKIKEFNIKIDSLEDILTNKAHTIFERYEPKDIFDFYCILKMKKFKFEKVFAWLKKKFGGEIDPVLFVSRLLRGLENFKLIKPIIIRKDLYQPREIEKFFKEETEKFLRKKLK